jgi:hypothetical protein
MAQAALLRNLVGPFGLHALGAVLLALFVGFVLMFNFSTFF